MATFDTLVVLCQLLALEPSAHVTFRESDRYFNLQVVTPGATCKVQTSFWSGGQAEYRTVDTQLEATTKYPKRWSDYRREG